MKRPNGKYYDTKTIKVLTWPEMQSILEPICETKQCKNHEVCTVYNQGEILNSCNCIIWKRLRSLYTYNKEKGKNEKVENKIAEGHKYNDFKLPEVYNENV